MPWTVGTPATAALGKGKKSNWMEDELETD